MLCWSVLPKRPAVVYGLSSGSVQGKAHGNSSSLRWWRWGSLHRSAAKKNECISCQLKIKLIPVHWSPGEDTSPVENRGCVPPLQYEADIRARWNLSIKKFSGGKTGFHWKWNSPQLKVILDYILTQNKTFHFSLQKPIFFKISHFCCFFLPLNAKKWKMSTVWGPPPKYTQFSLSFLSFSTL